MRAIAYICGILTLLCGAGGAWLLWSTITQPEVLAPALAASAAVAAAMTIIPYCAMRAFEMFAGVEKRSED